MGGFQLNYLSVEVICGKIIEIYLMNKSVYSTWYLCITNREIFWYNEQKKNITI